MLQSKPARTRIAAFALVLLAATFVLALGLLGACSSSPTVAEEAAESPHPTQVIIAMGKSSEPEAGFNPILNWGAGEHMHEPLIQSTLFSTTVAMGFENDLATSYASSDEGLTWTFSLRDDVVFTDGVPLTAHDVAFTFNAILTNPASEVDLSMVDSVVAPDDETVVMTLNKPFNALLYTLAVIGIVPEHAFDSSYGDNPIGSGRYMLEQWDKGQQVILVANPSYYGVPPAMERVIVVFMDEDAALAAARAGQVDLAATSAVYSGQTIEGFELLAFATVDSRGISLPTPAAGGTTADAEGREYAVGNAVTSDRAIRQAINCAVDRELMIENVLNGYGSVAYSVSDGMPWAAEQLVVKQDSARARQLLDEAGWVPGEDGFRSRDGVEAAFTVWYPASDSVRQGLANEFANQMKGIGLKVSAEGAGWDEIYSHQFSSPILWGWGSNAPTELYHLYYSTGSANFSRYESATLDEQYDEALTQNQVEDSYRHWQLGTAEVGPEAAATWVWLANVDHLYFARDDLNVAEQKLHPHGHGWAVANNVDQWTWK
ncbi:MAG: ABC transporter substrate-binding protein [Coriobacteriales bacterium]|jgi:peptide/nickel transport system substrate-binding protein|nr:ABC transporter substrate-binding protein [Coriobacteriales bacterium]